MNSLFLSILSLFMGAEVETQYQCLKEAIYYEAGNQSLQGKLYVGQVIKNRVAHDKFPDDYCAVIRQRNQFSYYWDGKPEHLPRENNKFEHKAVEHSSWLAMALLALPLPDYTDASVFYHTTNIEPPLWASSMSVTVVVDDHIMYRF